MGADATGSIKSELLIEHLADESVLLPLAWVYDQRAKMIRIFRQSFEPRTAGVLIASLLGDKYFLDRETADLFRDGGTFHILVISGLHITFIGGILLLIIRQLTRNRWAQFIVTSVVLWGYTLSVGADVPVVRASIMFTLVLYSYVIYRPSSLLNTLGTCGLILLVWRPSDLLNSSFQLTFVSVAAIVAIAYPLIQALRSIGTWIPTPSTPFPPKVPNWLKHFCETIYWREESWSYESGRQVWTANIIKSPYLAKMISGGWKTALLYIFEGLLVSVIVQLSMLPLIVVYFHRLSLASPILNLWVGFLIAIESLFALFAAAAGNLSSVLAVGFIKIAELCNSLMLLLPRLISESGIASFRLPAYSGPGRAIYFLYFIPVIVLAIFVHTWNPFTLKPGKLRFGRLLIPSASALSIFIAVIVLHPLSAPKPDGLLHIDFFDVGQGDSALVTFPDGKTLLVDGGGKVSFRKIGDDDDFDPDVRRIGESVVSEILWNKGLSRIDYIIATHADADHMQGLGDVAKNFEVGAAIFGRTPPRDPEFVELAEILEKRGIRSEIVGRGEIFEIDGVRIEVLYPAASDDPDAPSDNDNSVVIRIVFGERSFLLTGDIEQSAESSLSTGGDLKADVIKVAHHGSRTSSTQQFIDAIGAKYAIISVGRHSPFGHPYADVVERWRAAGAEVLTTGENGMISAATDGRELRIAVYQPNR